MRWQNSLVSICRISVHTDEVYGVRGRVLRGMLMDDANLNNCPGRWTDSKGEEQLAEIFVRGTP
jgi:hypothetical protein